MGGYIVFMDYKASNKKIPFLPILVYKLNAISIKIPAHYSGEKLPSRLKNLSENAKGQD